ncbi:hypothetical protein B0H13DRAFT_2321704 [Mycena leptocephala]|nr:hypothetical protein B0H13DRAFT_2321704 [Mycena leptocephala]
MPFQLEVNLGDVHTLDKLGIPENTDIKRRLLVEDSGKSSTVAFFYFDFKAKDGNALDTALRRMVLRLSAQSPYPYSALNKQYRLSHGQGLPNYQDLQSIFKELLRDLGRTYIVLDALDECPDTEFGQLMNLISTLRGCTSGAFLAIGTVV